MPRFYFDVFAGGDSFSRDDTGVQLANLNAAEYEAVKAAAEMGRDTLPKRLSPELCVRVRDEHGQTVLSVALSMTVRRMDHTHA